jgi:hypothetical protein
MFTLTEGEWVTGREAARLLCVPTRYLPCLVRAGALHPRDLPGVRNRFSRAECLALAKPPAPRAVPTA